MDFSDNRAFSMKMGTSYFEHFAKRVGQISVSITKRHTGLVRRIKVEIKRLISKGK